MTRPELKSFLQSRYDRARWTTLLHHLLPTTQVFGSAQPLDFSADSIASAAQLARIPLAGDRTVAVLEVRVTGQVDLQRNRVGLRNLVSRFIGQQGADAVLAFFVGFSLLRRRPWGRTLGIVVAILSLLKFPIGTALGIYTLWVLVPAESAAEYDAIADHS